METEDLLHRYFGTNDISALSSERLASGIQRCRADISTEPDQSKRFDLWAFLQLLVLPSHSEVTLLNEEYRDAARCYLNFITVPKEIRGA